MVSQSLTNKPRKANSNWQEFFRPHGTLSDRFTQKLPCFLRTLDDLPTAVDALLRSKLLVSPQKLLLRKKKKDESVTVDHQLRCIQVQVSVRVGLWAFAGTTFTDPFGRIIRERKKNGSKRRALSCCSQQDSTSVILEELISILQLAAFLLGPETSFASFLAQCINRPCYEAIPILRHVFKHFECPNPYVEEAPVPLRPLQRRRRPNVVPPQQQMEKTQPKEKSLLKENSRPFTAPAVRRNTLLQGKTRYVGSHFNNHSGVASLFRSGALPTAPSNSKPVVTPREKPPQQQQRGTKRRLLVPATPRCSKKTKAKASPAVGSLVAQAFQSIDQGNRRRRRK